MPGRIEIATRATLSLLEGCRARATFFALGWVAARHQALVREIHARGHEVATHGYMHRSIPGMSDEEFLADLRRGREAVEGATGEAVVGHRAARWSLGGVPGAGPRRAASGVATRALDLLIREGIRYDASLAPIVWIGDPTWPLDPYRIERPGGTIEELPPLVGRFLGARLLFGSGWALRRVPVGVLRREIFRRNVRGAAALLDLHVWELDPDPPRIELPFIYRLAHYDGLRGFAGKLRTLLSGFSWVPVRDYLRDHARDAASGSTGQAPRSS